MNKNKFAEFITVLIVAVILSGAAIYSIYNLTGITRNVAIAVILILAFAAIQLLRKKFGRGK